MKKREILALTVLTVMTMSLVGCGEAKEAAKETAKVEVADETSAVVVQNEEEKAKENADVEEVVTADGALTEDFAGLYGYEYESPYEGEEGVMFTDWYYFFPNHKGVYVGQDSIYFDWDDNGVISNEGGMSEKVSYDAAKQCITISESDNEYKDRTEYTKFAGNVIMPGNNYGNVENCDDGIYHASFFGESITGDEVNFRLYVEDAFDIVDVHCLAVGDAIMYGNMIWEIEKIDEEDGKKIINRDCPGKAEVVLTAQDESNCFTASDGFVDRTLTFVGEYSFALTDNAVLTITTDGKEEEFSKETLIEKLKECYGNEDTTTIRTEGGKVAEIHIN